MARIKLDTMNYIDWDTGELPQETLDIWIEGLAVTYDLENGWTNDFGHPLLEFVGPRADLEILCDRYEEDKELLHALLDDIADE